MGHRDEKRFPLAEMCKDAMRQLVERGDEPGLLAYQDRVPAGWGCRSAAYG